MTDRQSEVLSKVPAVTLGFWVIKILATTLGETGGDTVTMTMNWGYLAGSAPFVGLLVVLVILQIRARRFHPLLYWATIVASTTAGTTMADFADRSLGIGYAGGASRPRRAAVSVQAAPALSWLWCGLLSSSGGASRAPSRSTASAPPAPRPST